MTCFCIWFLLGPSFVLYRLLPVVSCPSDNALGALTGVHLSIFPFPHGSSQYVMTFSLVVGHGFDTI